MTIEENELTDADLSDLDFWARPLEVRDRAFASLRRQPHPVFFSEPDWEELLGAPEGTGYYALVKYADIVEVSHNPEVFCSSEGGAASVIDMPDDFLAFFDSLINMDGERHNRLRRIVSRAFTPRIVATFKDHTSEVAARIIDDVIEQGHCDFVDDIATKLPLKVICDMVGVPEESYDVVYKYTNVILGNTDPEYVPNIENLVADVRNAGTILADLGKQIAADRRDNPRDDLTTALVHANVDRESLTDRELASFFIMLTVAGFETTRTAMAHGLYLLDQWPEQRKLWAADFEKYSKTAIEEILRLSSPTIFMRRRAKTDYDLNGFTIHKGDKVMMYYYSGNRDETVFSNPDTFDITRDPNPHITFGGGGAHFCLGAHLARHEMEAIFRQIFQRIPDIRVVGKPQRLLSLLVNGIKHMQCEFTPGQRLTVQ